jgi:hypothetical protein
MDRDQKALLYDDYVRQGDSINRQISKLKSNVNLTVQEEAELTRLKGLLSNLEKKVEQLFLN